MPVSVVCTHCDTSYTIEDRLVGKKLLCKSCGEAFLAQVVSSDLNQGIVSEAIGGSSKVPAWDRAEPPAIPKRRRAQEENDEEDARPRRRHRAAPPPAPVWPWVMAAAFAGIAVICGIAALGAMFAFDAGPGVLAPPPQVVIGPNAANFQVPNRPVIAKEVVKPATKRVSTEAQVSNLTAATFDTSTQVALLNYTERNVPGDMVDAFDLKTGKRLGKFANVRGAPQAMDISPDGSLALLQSPGTLSIRRVTDGEIVVGDWAPPIDVVNQGRGAVGAGNLIWAKFLSNDRMVTVHGSGIVTFWKIPEKVREGSLDSLKTGFLTFDFFAKQPQGVALSPDRKMLAITNRVGYQFIDTTERKVVGVTLDWIGGRIGNEWSVAFSADGKKLAARFRIQGQGESDYVAAWNVADGAKILFQPIQQNFQVGVVHWWGPDHLLLSNAVSEGRLLKVSDGKFYGHFRMQIPAGKWLGCDAQGIGWYAKRPRFDVNQNAPLECVAVPFPDEIVRNQPGIAGLDGLPPWYFDNEGITRD